MTATTRSSHRPGLSLVEMLVVVGILAVLVGLLLPAVQKVRAAAARANCANRLKQLATAVHTHSEALGRLPHGGEHYTVPPTYVSAGTPASGPKQAASWMFQILPYIEQQPVWSGGGGATVADCQINAIRSEIRVLFCPARRGPQSFVKPAWYGPPGADAHALTDYAGNVGDTSNGPLVPVSNGAYRNGFMTFVRITDGTSNTILLGDKRLNVARLGGDQLDDNEGYTSGWDQDTLRYVSSAYTPRPDIYDGDGDGGHRFGSSHGAGFQAAFCDGHVDIISYDIDPNIFDNIGSICDDTSSNRQLFLF